jgi:signal peptidase I
MRLQSRSEIVLNAQQTSARPRLHRAGWLHEIADTAVLIVAVFALVNLSSARYMVEGKSMFPNFDDYQVLYVSRLNYMLGAPERNDVIVFHYPNNPSEDYIKRVIGLPGETVTIRDTRVFVDDSPLDEPYINEACDLLHCPDQSHTLGPDQYFVMGDNRNHSSDSRAFGPVDRRLIVGEVLIRYWPPPEWGIVTQIGAPGPTP